MAAPTAPQNVSYSSFSSTEAVVNWDAPTDWGGDEGSYELEIERDGGGFVSPNGGPSSVASGTTTATYNPQRDASYGSMIGLDSNIQFRVRATNVDGSSSWETTSVGRSKPTRPHDATITRTGTNTFEFNWVNKTDLINDGIAIDAIVEAIEDTGSGYGTWSQVGSVDVQNDVTTLTIDTSTTGINEDARYQFRISYNTSDGLGGTVAGDTNYVDYGNNGNVYFEDSFEDGDLGGWTTAGISDTSNTVQSGSNANVNISGADDGTYYIVLEDGDYIYRNLGDLSSETNVIVKLRMAIGLYGTDSAQALHIRIHDGSTWQSIASFHNEYNKQGWVDVVAEVPDSYLNSDTFLQFYNGGSGTNRSAIDDIIVSDRLHEYTKPADASNIVLDTTVQEEYIRTSWTSNATFATSVGDVDYKKSADSTWIDHSESADPVDIGPLEAGTQYDVRSNEFIEQYRYGTNSNRWETTDLQDSATPEPLEASVTTLSTTASTSTTSATSSAQPSVTTLGAVASTLTAQTSSVAVRRAVVTGGGRAGSAAVLDEVFPSQSSADLDFELITYPVTGFASEWFYEDSHLGNGRSFGVMLDAEIADSLELRVQYDKDGNGEPDYTTSAAEIKHDGQPIAFSELGEDGYYRIIISGMGRSDLLREVGEGPTEII